MLDFLGVGGVAGVLGWGCCAVKAPEIRVYEYGVRVGEGGFEGYDIVQVRLDEGCAESGEGGCTRGGGGGAGDAADVPVGEGEEGSCYG